MHGVIHWSSCLNKCQMQDCRLPGGIRPVNRQFFVVIVEFNLMVTRLFLLITFEALALRLLQRFVFRVPVGWPFWTDVEYSVGGVFAYFLFFSLAVAPSRARFSRVQLRNHLFWLVLWVASLALLPAQFFSIQAFKIAWIFFSFGVVLSSALVWLPISFFVGSENRWLLAPLALIFLIFPASQELTSYLWGHCGGFFAAPIESAFQLMLGRDFHADFISRQANIYIHYHSFNLNILAGCSGFEGILIFWIAATCHYSQDRGIRAQDLLLSLVLGACVLTALNLLRLLVLIGLGVWLGVERGIHFFHLHSGFLLYGLFYVAYFIPFGTPNKLHKRLTEQWVNDSLALAGFFQKK
jgi:exosortase/archaeosortase family protein